MDKKTIFELAKQYGEQAYSDNCGFFPEGGSRPSEARLEAALDGLIAERDKLRQALLHAAAALDEAAVDLGDWGAYADEYTRKKFSLGDDVKYYERAASRAREFVTPNVDVTGPCLHGSGGQQGSASLEPSSGD